MAEKIIKLNLGCGGTITDGWINYDNSLNNYLSKIPAVKTILYHCGLINETSYKPWPKGIHTHDVTKGLPHDSNTVDYIYTSHFLEHLTKSQAEKLLIECKRVLKTDGIIRISVPDLKIIAKRYVNGELDGEGFLDGLYVFPKLKKTKAEKIFPMLFKKDQHKWMYDYESLYNLLNKLGYSEIKQKQFKVGNVPDLDKLDNRATESMFVEAKKK